MRNSIFTQTKHNTRTTFRQWENNTVPQGSQVPPNNRKHRTQQNHAMTLSYSDWLKANNNTISNALLFRIFRLVNYYDAQISLPNHFKNKKQSLDMSSAICMRQVKKNAAATVDQRSRSSEVKRSIDEWHTSAEQFHEKNMKKWRPQTGHNVLWRASHKRCTRWPKRESLAE